MPGMIWSSASHRGLRYAKKCGPKPVRFLRTVSNADTVSICAGAGFRDSAPVSQKRISGNTIVRSADQNLSAFCCSHVWHYRQPCRNRKRFCRFFLLQAAPSMSTLTCVSEPREQNESSLFMAWCSRTMTLETGRLRRIR